MPDTEPLRRIAMRALADQAEPEVVDAMIERLGPEAPAATGASRRRQYADLLTRVHRKPGPWVYWGYRPPPRPANTVDWERTEAIGQALERLLADADRSVRLLVLRRMQREKIPTPLPALARWLRGEREAGAVAALLEALRPHAAGDVLPLLSALVADKKHTPANRLTALAMLAAKPDEAGMESLRQLAGTLEDGPVLAEALRRMGARPALKASALLRGKTDSPDPAVRAAALDALAELRATDAAGPARRLLDDPDGRVRRAAAAAAGKLGVRDAADALMKLVQDADPAVRRESFTALRLLRESRVVPRAVSALTDPETQVAALRCVSELGGPAQADAVADTAKRNPSSEVLPLVVRTLTRWGEQERTQRPELDRRVAELHGASGVLVRWNVSGPLTAKEAASLVERSAEVSASWQTVFAAGLDARVTL